MGKSNQEGGNLSVQVNNLGEKGHGGGSKTQSVGSKQKKNC